MSGYDRGMGAKSSAEIEWFALRGQPTIMSPIDNGALLARDSAGPTRDICSCPVAKRAPGGTAPGG